MTPDLPRPWIFLAGAIDRGRAAPWQNQVIDAYDGDSGTLLNPRREIWNPQWDQSVNNPEFITQVTWEMEGLDQADIILMWFPSTAMAPISLLELGLSARSGRIIVGCEPGYHRRANVLAVCARYGITCWASLGDTIAAVRARRS